MKGFIRKTVAGFCLATGSVSLTGCFAYRHCVDPCWPERYNYQARSSVIDTLGAQTHNGHVLDQTIWSHYFEVDRDEKTKDTRPTDRLNAAGQEHLKYLARRRPQPDPKLYLQTAQDMPTNMALEQMTQFRADLDSKRVLAIQTYLNFLMADRADRSEFHVVIHDPATPYLYAVPIAGSRTPTAPGSLQDLYSGFKGSIQAQQGSLGGGGSGGGGGGGR